MSKRFRLLLVIGALVVAGIFLFPSLQWYFLFGDREHAQAQAGRPEIQRQVTRESDTIIRSLRQLAQEDEFQPLPEDQEVAIAVVRARFRENGEAIPSPITVRTALDLFITEGDLRDEIARYLNAQFEEAKTIRSRIILLGLDLSGGVQVVLEPDVTSLEERLGSAPTEAQIAEALDLALAVINNRIDRFGITEPQIRRRSDNTVEIEIPGEADPERVNAFLVGKGQLNFHIVDDQETERLLQYVARDPNWDPESSQQPNFIPAGLLAMPYYTRDEFGIEQYVRHIVVHENIEENGLSGDYIRDAQFIRDPLTNQPLVNFELDITGSNRFATLTRENVGNSMAIVVDDQVRAWAVIQEEIPSGQVRISGFEQIEAQNISRVLRTAALPIDLEILSQQEVGAQIGEETVRSGLIAVLAGFILVALFILSYYKGAGFIADIMLLVNLYLLISILAVFNLTLTLTSIAGIILTVGMAVDANIIIFERIKEEYRLGKSAQASVSAGFRKAFWTIMDANVTTFIAALFLSQFGSGPIKGFATTLAVGIVTSMFTSLFISRLIFDFITEVLRRPRLSISWRRS